MAQLPPTPGERFTSSPPCPPRRRSAGADPSGARPVFLLIASSPTLREPAP
jgi:hypothetical protein